MSAKRVAGALSATVRFTHADQQAFARLSGDFNPVHVDPAFARHAFPGQPIVHGMHLVLRALDVYFRRTRKAAGSFRLSARFLKPAFLLEPIAVDEVDDAGA
ncbi:MAG: MaoC family dehydratase, partial [Vicinamibacterales bacterium]